MGENALTLNDTDPRNPTSDYWQARQTLALEQIANLLSDAVVYRFEQAGLVIYKDG
jgi:hypothetical protein